MKVTANQPFYGSASEGMWQVGQSRTVAEKRGEELLKLGLVDNVSEEGAAATKPSDPNARQTKPAKDKPDTK